MTAKILQELTKYDTPSVTNVVATYPKNPLCLGLYNPWTINWYTDHSIRCIYPELGASAGYAVTAVVGLPDPDYERLTMMDVFDAIDAAPSPSILVIQQNYPADIAGKVGLAGGNMATALQVLGCVGMVSNGPSRDLDEIRALKWQMLLSGATPGHGTSAVHAVNVPVSVGGMDVSPGEIVHMDESGACKFPPEHMETVAKNVRQLLSDEADKQALMRKAKSSADIRAIFAGGDYSGKEDKKRAGSGKKRTKK